MIARAARAADGESAWKPEELGFLVNREVLSGRAGGAVHDDE